MDGIDQSLIDDFLRRKEACKTPEELRKFLRAGLPRRPSGKGRKPEHRKGTIYFILDRTANAVKIGFTTVDVETRALEVHQEEIRHNNNNPNPLELIHTVPGRQCLGPVSERRTAFAASGFVGARRSKSSSKKPAEICSRFVAEPGTTFGLLNLVGL